MHEQLCALFFSFFLKGSYMLANRLYQYLRIMETLGPPELISPNGTTKIGPTRKQPQSGPVQLTVPTLIPSHGFSEIPRQIPVPFEFRRSNSRRGAVEVKGHERPMKAFRLLSQIKKLSPSLSLHRIAPFSSRPAAANPRFPNSFSDEAPGISSVYRHALKFQRPTTIHPSGVPKNSASFIGTVLRPPKVLNTKDGKFGVYTVLNVETSPQRNYSFRSAFFFRFC